MSAREKLAVRAAAVLIVAVAAAGCAGPDDRPDTLAIFAASSLAEAIADLGTAFEAEHPGVRVRPTFAGSQVLRLQIQQGAPADLFASASAAHVMELERAGLIEAPQAFATNELVVIVPPDNPAGIESFADLPGARRIVVGDVAVPVGEYTRRVLERTGAALGAEFASAVESSIVSAESNVRLVRAKVELGEADAAFVYRTDAVESRVRTIDIPAALNVRASYFVGVVAGSPNAELAREWVGFLASDTGRSILERHGFGTMR